MRFFSNTTLENEVCRPKSGINLYPFGMEMPGRKWQGTSDKYRYGMNTQEKDDEIFEGAMGAEFWEYDSRIGRRWNLDLVIRPWEGPYTTFNNNPIIYADPSGLDGDDKTKAMPGSNAKRSKENSETTKGNWDHGKELDKGNDGKNNWESRTDGDVTMVHWSQADNAAIGGYYSFPSSNSTSNASSDSNGGNDNENTGGKNPSTSQPPSTDKPEQKSPPNTDHKEPPSNRKTDPVEPKRPKDSPGGTTHTPPFHLPHQNQRIQLPTNNTLPCNPINGLINFKWNLNKASPLDPSQAFEQLSGLFNQWRPCNTLLMVNIQTSSKFDDRNTNYPNVEGGTISNLLLLRFHYIRRTAIDLGIPASNIIRLPEASWQFEHKHGGVDLTQDAHIRMR